MTQSDEPAPPPQATSEIGSPRTLHAGMRKWLMVSVIGAAFVAIGIFLIIAKGDFLAWFTTIFFGVVTAVGLLQLFGVGSRLDLGADTFTVTNFGRQTIERWDETANFGVYRTGHNELVAYDRARDVDTHMAEMNRMLSGGSAGLPDTFGMPAQHLADLMNAYQAAAVERAWHHHKVAVEKFKNTIADELATMDIKADIITAPTEMHLPADMSPWPSILVISQASRLDASQQEDGPRSDSARHVLICADIPSPLSRWLTDDTKRTEAFDGLAADQLYLVDPTTGAIQRIKQETSDGPSQ